MVMLKTCPHEFKDCPFEDNSGVASVIVIVIVMVIVTRLWQFLLNAPNVNGILETRWII